MPEILTANERRMFDRRSRFRRMLTFAKQRALNPIMARNERLFQIGKKLTAGVGWSFLTGQVKNAFGIFGQAYDAMSEIEVPDWAEDATEEARNQLWEYVCSRVTRMQDLSETAQGISTGAADAYSRVIGEHSEEYLQLRDRVRTRTGDQSFRPELVLEELKDILADIKFDVSKLGTADIKHCDDIYKAAVKTYAVRCKQQLLLDTIRNLRSFLDGLEHISRTLNPDSLETECRAKLWDCFQSIPPENHFSERTWSVFSPGSMYRATTKHYQECSREYCCGPAPGSEDV